MSERTLSLGLTAPWMSRPTNHSKSSVGIRADRVCICIHNRLHLYTNAYNCLHSVEANGCQGLLPLRGRFPLRSRGRSVGMTNTAALCCRGAPADFTISKS